MIDTMTSQLDSPAAVAEALVAHRVEQRRVGAERLALAAHWCDLHPVVDDPMRLQSAASRRQVGAAGTPEVSEFAAEELGCLLGVHPHAAHVLMADALNLRHRHPRLWRRLMAGEVVDWIAAKTARACAAAGLDLDQARWVDAVTHSYVASLPPSRYLALVEAKIIEADPAGAEARREAAALDRFVRTGQSCEDGLKTLVARATAGDIIYFVAVVDRIAQILALHGDGDSGDVRRSKALGILATPARALRLLAEAEADETDSAEEPATDHGTRNDAALNAAVAEKIAATPAHKLLPTATLYVHISAEALAAGFGVARMEGVGPITLGQASDFLGHCNVTLKPVVDLAGGMPVDAYEIPERMREVVQLRTPYDVFPFSSRTSRDTDGDHSKPYRPGIRGQTHPDNLGPLNRRHHRLKTHAPGWRLQRLAPHVYLWRTPTGHWFHVDATGTRHLGNTMTAMEQHFLTLLAA